MKQIITLFCIGIILVMTIPVMATELIDCHENQLTYGIYVAALTKGITGEVAPKASKRVPPTLVFLKTDGSIIDFSSFSLLQIIQGPHNRYTLAFAEREGAESAVKLFSGNPHILYAETDSIIEACETAVTEDFSFHSYAADQMGFQPLLSWAKKSTTMRSVAIIDSGVSRHRDISSRLTHGWDYIDNDDDPSNDGSGHGTHVAGIVADCTQGATVSLYAIRVLDDDNHGKSSNAANGILEAVENGVDIINLSFASSTESAFLDDAVYTAVSSGCTVIVSAGNGGTSTSGICPAHNNLSGIIVVGAADANGARASYSNYGESVDMYAYGSGISSCYGNGGYIERSGTSQAAPHIAAACALLSIINPSLTPARLENRLKGCTIIEPAPIPHVDSLVPKILPLHVSSLELGIDESLQLPTEALPYSCETELAWISLNHEIVSIDSAGVLHANQTGSTSIICQCSNFEPVSILVTVQVQPSRRFILPTGLTTICDEVFQGVPVQYLIAGAELQSLSINALESSAVILCENGTPLADFAEIHGLQYIAR